MKTFSKTLITVAVLATAGVVYAQTSGAPASRNESTPTAKPPMTSPNTTGSGTMMKDSPKADAMKNPNESTATNPPLQGTGRGAGMARDSATGSSGAMRDGSTTPMARDTTTGRDASGTRRDNTTGMDNSGTRSDTVARAPRRDRN